MTAAFAELPGSAAWRHRDAREGFEAVFVRADGPGGHRFTGFTGHTAAVFVRRTASRWSGSSRAAGCSIDPPAGEPGGKPGVLAERFRQGFEQLFPGDRRSQDYRSPAFGSRGQLVYDGSRLVIDYPGIARRVS